jgi:hypothetical protein
VYTWKGGGKVVRIRRKVAARARPLFTIVGHAAASRLHRELDPEHYGALFMATHPPEPMPRVREPHHLVLALATVTIVFAAFAPTFYLNAYFAQRHLDPLRVAHGVVFSLWPLLLLAQVWLVKLGRTDLHRRLGLAGAVVAAAMVLLGTSLAVQAARFGLQTPGLPPAPVFLAVPLFDMVVFAALVAGAFVVRKRRADHSRLMILATLSILPAAFGRLPLPGVSDPIVTAFAPAFVLLLVCVTRDVLIHRRLHRAWLWGGSLFVLSVPLRLVVAGTAGWQRFAGWLIGA